MTLKPSHSVLQLKGKDGDKPIGRISKQWSGVLKEVFTDTDNFGIQFPLDMDVKMKAVLLGACFLIVRHVALNCSASLSPYCSADDLCPQIFLARCRILCSSRRWGRPTNAALCSHKRKRSHVDMRDVLHMCIQSSYMPCLSTVSSPDILVLPFVTLRTIISNDQ